MEQVERITYMGVVDHHPTVGDPSVACRLDRRQSDPTPGITSFASHRSKETPFGRSPCFVLLGDADLPPSYPISVALYSIVEDGRYAQTFGDAVHTDPSVQFFVRVVDTPLLIVEGYTPKPG